MLWMKRSRLLAFTAVSTSARKVGQRSIQRQEWKMACCPSLYAAIFATGVRNVTGIVRFVFGTQMTDRADGYLEVVVLLGQVDCCLYPRDPVLHMLYNIPR